MSVQFSYIYFPIVFNPYSASLKYGSLQLWIKSEK